MERNKLEMGARRKAGGTFRDGEAWSERHWRAQSEKERHNKKWTGMVRKALEGTVKNGGGIEKDRGCSQR